MKSWRQILPLLILTCALASDGLAQRVIEKIEDSYVIEIDGKVLRAITPEKTAELSALKSEVVTLRELKSTLTEKNSLLTQRIAVLEQSSGLCTQQVTTLSDVLKRFSEPVKPSRTQQSLDFLNNVGQLAFQIYLSRRR